MAELSVALVIDGGAWVRSIRSEQSGLSDVLFGIRRREERDVGAEAESCLPDGRG